MCDMIMAVRVCAPRMRGDARVCVLLARAGTVCWSIYVSGEEAGTRAQQGVKTYTTCMMENEEEQTAHAS